MAPAAAHGMSRPDTYSARVRRALQRFAANAEAQPRRRPLKIVVEKWRRPLKIVVERMTLAELEERTEGPFDPAVSAEIDRRLSRGER
jgi:hypothetical protein